MNTIQSVFTQLIVPSLVFLAGSLMAEIDTIKVMAQAGFAGLAAGLVVVIFWMVRGNQTSEQGLMRIVEKMIGITTGEFSKLYLTTQQSMETLVKDITTQQETATRDMITQIAESMAPTIKAREDQTKAITDHVLAVPGTVWELGDPRLNELGAKLREWITGQQAEILSQIPSQAEIAREVVKAELESDQTRFYQECGKIFTRLDEIAKDVKTIKGCKESPTPVSDSKAIIPVRPATQPDPPEPNPATA